MCKRIMADLKVKYIVEIICDWQTLLIRIWHSVYHNSRYKEIRILGSRERPLDIRFDTSHVHLRNGRFRRHFACRCPAIIVPSAAVKIRSYSSRWNPAPSVLALYILRFIYCIGRKRSPRDGNKLFIWPSLYVCLCLCDEQFPTIRPQINLRVSRNWYLPEDVSATDCERTWEGWAGGTVYTRFVIKISQKIIERQTSARIYENYAEIELKVRGLRAKTCLYLRTTYTPGRV